MKTIMTSKQRREFVGQFAQRLHEFPGISSAQYQAGRGSNGRDYAKAIDDFLVNLFPSPTVPPIQLENCPETAQRRFVGGQPLWNRQKPLNFRIELIRDFFQNAVGRQVQLGVADFSDQQGAPVRSLVANPIEIVETFKSMRRGQEGTYCWFADRFLSVSGISRTGSVDKLICDSNLFLNEDLMETWRHLPLFPFGKGTLTLWQLVPRPATCFSVATEDQKDTFTIEHDLVPKIFKMNGLMAADLLSWSVFLAGEPAVVDQLSRGRISEAYLPGTKISRGSDESDVLICRMSSSGLKMTVSTPILHPDRGICSFSVK